MSELMNAALVRFEGGWRWREDAGSITANGRAEARFDLGGYRDVAAADADTDTVLAYSSQPRRAAVADIEPAADDEYPYIGFEPFDTVNVRDHTGAMLARKVRGVSCRLDAYRWPAWTLELGDLTEHRAAQVDRMLRRTADGLLEGRSETANPARPALPVDSGQVHAKQWRASKDATSTVMESQGEQFETPVHVMLWHVTLSPADGGEFAGYASDVTVRLMRSTSTDIVATVTVPAGEQSAWAGVAAADGFYNTTDRIWAYISAGPTDVALVATARYL